MTCRVLITGGSGLLALNWALALRGSCDVTLGLHTRSSVFGGVKARRLSLDSIDRLRQEMDETEPNIVIHAAGLASVEQCEDNPTLARFVNVDLAKNVATVCAEKGIALVHISTDHLFSGDRQMVGETEPVEPKNVYGMTKAEAEIRVLEAKPDALVVRTNFFGWGPTYRHSFSDLVVDALQSGREVTLFTDVYYTPILAETLALATHQLLEHKVSGICNVSGNDRISKHEFGCRLAGRFGLDSGLIKAGTLSGRTGLVSRPFDMSLSNRKLRACGIEVGGVDHHVDRLFQQEKCGDAREIRQL